MRFRLAVLVLACLAALPAAAQQPRDLVVNEINYAFGGSDLEYVEVYNRSDAAFDLATLGFGDAVSGPSVITDDAANLAPGGYALLVSDLVAFQAAFDVPAGAVLVEPPSWPALNNGGDTVFLYDGTSEGAQVLDAVPYQPSWGGETAALERLDPDGASDVPANWATSTAADGGTPGDVNSVFDPDTEPPSLLSASATVSRDSVIVLFSEPLDPSTVAASDFALTPASAPQPVSAEVEGRTVRLELDGTLADGAYAVLLAGSVADLPGNAQAEGEAPLTVFTPAAPAPGEVAVNEILYDPADSEDAEFVEILNVTDDATFDLSSFLLADDRLEPVAITDAATPLAPGEYAVLVRDLDAFQTAFPDAPATVSVIEVPSWPALNNGGDTPTLIYDAGDGATTIDAVPYVPAWGGTGASLERRVPEGPSNVASNWGTTTDEDDGTPGQENSLFGITDTEPPTLGGAAYDDALPGFRLTFSEALDPASVQAADFSIAMLGTPASVALDEGDTVALLTLATPPPVGTYDVTVSGVTDAAGNAIEETTVEVEVVRDEEPPALLAVQRDDGDVLALFSEPLDPASVALSDFALLPDGAPALTAFTVSDDTVRLEIAEPLAEGTYTLRVTDVADLAGNVLTEAEDTFAVFEPGVPDPLDVVVNEILYDPPSTQDAEFVELVNTTDEVTFDLNQFYLADSRMAPVPLTDAPTVLPPGGYAVLVRDLAAFDEFFDVPAGVPVVEAASWPAMNDGGDTAALFYIQDEDTTLIDAVPYEPAWGGGDGRSLERRDPLGPSAMPSNFGTTFDADGGTPGERNTLFEIDEEPPAFVEARATAGRDTVVVDFDEPLDPATVALSDFALAPSGSFTGAEVLGSEVWLALDAPLESGTYTVSLAGNIADFRGNEQTDGSASFTVFTPDVPAPHDLVVNEIMYAPAEAEAEFVELHNRTEDQTFSLAQFHLADSRLDLVPVTSSATPVPPGGYAVLVRDLEAFRAAFPDVAKDAPVVEVASWPALNDGGDTAALFYIQDEDTTLIDAVPYEPAWGGGDGVSLERRDPNGSSTSASNFGTSEDPQGGTPGELNSIFGVDETPPQLVEARATASRDTVIARFSEALDPVSVQAGDFSLGGAPLGEVTLDGEVVQIALGGVLPTGTYTLAVEDVADFSGNVLERGEASFEVFVGAVPEPGDVVLNEILYAPESGGSEFVELYNRTEEAFDLAQLRLADATSDLVPLTDLSIPLAPNGYAVLTEDTAALALVFPDLPSGVPVLQVEGFPALNNSGDVVAVAYEDETLLDAVPYEASWGGGTGVSLARRDPAGPSAFPINWGSSTAPAGGTPGMPNSIFGPDTAAPLPLFAEEFDATTILVAFDEPLDPATVEAADFEAGGSVPSEVALVEGGTTARLLFDAPPEAATLTIRDVADFTGNVLTEATVAVAAAPTPNDIVINEIMYDPLADDEDGLPDQTEYVELLNTSERALTLRGLFLTDRPNEDGDADTLRLAFPDAPATVSAGGYALLFAQPDLNEVGGPLADSSALALAFPDLDFSDDALLPFDRSSLSLTNSGGLIRVHRADGLALASVAYDPAWHLPGINDPTGIALERLEPGGPDDAATNWTSSPAETGGTPGVRNAALPAEDPELREEPGLTASPSPFSPDGDGFDDVTFLTYRLEAPAALARIRIFDQAGRLVYEDDAQLVGPSGRIPWNGLDDDGRRLRIGIYVVLFEALNGSGGTVETFKEVVVLARPL